MEALHDIIKAGKVRYIGASSMYAWQFAKLQHAADLGGWTWFVSMQNQYNLLRRHDEPELMAMCGDMGVGLVPYSPNGKGRLARPAGEQSPRSSTDKVVQAFDSPYDEPVINAVQKLAEARGVSMAQIALAWVLRNPLVSAPIVGATKPHHLPEAVDALGLELPTKRCKHSKRPTSSTGHRGTSRFRPAPGSRRSNSPAGAGMGESALASLLGRGISFITRPATRKAPETGPFSACPNGPYPGCADVGAPVVLSPVPPDR